jgi:hypothetical protein
MLKITFKGESLLHRELWRVVKMQADFAEEQEEGSFYTNLVAMVFAFHTVEAYLNFVGGRLAPEVWRDERNYFRNEPYRGFEGKLRKVMELVGLRWREPADRPFKTILELKALRDLIAHAKPETLAGEIPHPTGTEPPIIVPSLHQMVTGEKRAEAVSDVEHFLNQIHSLAAPKVKDDRWFGTRALRGPSYHFFSHTQLSNTVEGKKPG